MSLSGFLERRLPIRSAVRDASRKLFPSHWSFLLGEISLFSLVALVLSGLYLALFYRPSAAPVVYRGSLPSMTGRAMPEAFVSVLALSLDVPFGLVVRRIHHFAAHLLIASLLLHAARVFFTGAFRRPREITWWVGLALLALALLNGVSGYALPFDMRGGTAIRMMLTTLESVPWVGGWLGTLAFGTTFPGPLILSRLFLIHALLGPALLVALVAVHLYLVVRLTHTDFPGPGRSERFEVGGPAWPDQAARSAALACMVFACLAALSAVFPVEAIWEYGPFQPVSYYEPLLPDWFLLWIEGAFRILPGSLNFHLLGGNITNTFLGSIGLAAVVFGGCALYPLLEARLYGWSSADHHLLEDYRRTPFRTAFGLSGIVFLVLLSVAALNDRLAAAWQLSIPATNAALLALTLGLPPAVFSVTWILLRKTHPNALGRTRFTEGAPVQAALALVTGLGIVLSVVADWIRRRMRARVG